MSDDFFPLSPLAQLVKSGIYRHFKGGEYRMVGIAKSCDDPNQEQVLYQSLKTKVIWSRSLASFLDNVERGDYKGPRFTFLNE